MEDKFSVFKPVTPYKPDDSEKPAPRETGLAIATIALELLFKEKVFFRLIAVSTLSLTVIYGLFIVLYQSGRDMIGFPFDYNKVLNQLFLSENYILIFIFYLLTYFSIVFFNTALTHCAITYFNDEKPSVNASIQFCLSRLKVILIWSLISATIGFILRFLRYRIRDLKKILPLLLFAGGWSITTYLVIPVLVAEKTNLKEAIKRSGKLFKDTWGERLHAYIGIGIIGFLIFIVLMIPLFMLQNKQIIPMSITFGFTAIAAGIITSFTSGAGDIIRAGVYQYAIGGPTWFEREAIQNLFGTPEFEEEKNEG